MDKNDINKRIEKDAFAKVAFWQFMGFSILICIIWVSEILDLTSLFFRTRHVSPNIFRASLLTAGALITSIIVVGNTYIQQRLIIKGLIVVCSDCGKVKLSNESWEEMDKYIEKKTLAAFSHGLCPDCCRGIQKEHIRSQSTKQEEEKA